MFKFSRVVIYRACDHEVDRNDRIYSFFSIAIIVHCQLACSVFSNLRKHRSAVSLNLCSARRENSCGERFSFLADNESSFFSRSAGYLGNVSTILVGATIPFSELIHPLLKLPNCVLKIYDLSEARLFRLTPSSRTRHRLC